MTETRTPQFDADGSLIGWSGEETTPVADAPVVDAEAEEQNVIARIGSSVLDVGKGVVGGVRDGAQEMGATAEWLAGSAVHSVTGGNDLYWTGDDGFEWLNTDEAKARDDIPGWMMPDSMDEGGALTLPEVAENDTLVGSATRGISQFLTGYLTGGKLLQGVKAIGGAAVVTKAAVQGALADFASFDAHEDRLSNFLRDNVGLQDPITEYLSADEDDTVLEGKLKNTIEGLGLGLATDGLIRVFKVFKHAKKVQIEQGDEAAASVMNDAIAEIAEKEPQLFQPDLFDEVSDPNLATAGARQAHDQATAATGVIDDAADAFARPPEQAAEVSAYNAAGVRPPDQRPKVPVNTPQIKAALEREIALDRAGAYGDITQHAEGKLFNHDYMESDLDIKQVLNIAADAIDTTSMVGKTTFDDIAAGARDFLSDTIDVSPEVIDGALARMADNAANQPKLVVAGKMLVQDLSREIHLLAPKVADKRATAAEEALMLRLMERLGDVSANLKSVITGSAQSTAAGRIRTHEFLSGQQLAAADVGEQLMDTLARNGGEAGVRDLARQIVSNGDAGASPRVLIKIGDAASSGKTMAVINEIRINGMLSGVKTQMINMVSNTINTVLLPAEKLIGGALGGDTASMKEAAIQFAGLANAFNDSMKAAWNAMRIGRNIIDPEGAILEANGIHRNAVVSQSSNPLIRNTVNSFGTVLRIPTRMLSTSDEFFKQINYRSELYAKLTGQAHDLVEQGTLQRSDVPKFISDRMRTAFNKDGSAASAEALAHAREATFTQPLREGTLPASWQKTVNKHPGLRLLTPFVRTPTNLIKAVIQRTPVLRRLSKSMMDDLASGDPARVASARGKMATGYAVWGWAVSMASQERITGGGPSDPALKTRMLEAGWQPYSFVFTNDDGSKKYVSYQRLDPFATFFGMSADIAEIGGQIDEAEFSELATAGVIALSRNIGSKTFLQGLTEFADALSQPDRKGAYYIHRQLTTMIPMSSALRDLRKLDDPAMRDVRTWVNALKNNIPGLSSTIAARRSWITGEPILYPKGWGKDMATPLGDAFAAANPIVESNWKQDPVLDELASIEYAFSAPTRTIMGKIELNEDQYSRLNELHGTVRIGRYTMKQRLETLFETQRYKAFKEAFEGGQAEADDPRVKLVQRVISQYRQASRQQLLKEYPELRAEAEDNYRDYTANVRSALDTYVGLGQ